MNVCESKSRRPKLPIAAGKAHQILSAAIILGEHKLASWIDSAVKAERILPSPNPEDLQHLRRRLNAVMEPLAP